jgi:hypothetical protein
MQEGKKVIVRSTYLHRYFVTVGINVLYLQYIFFGVTN